MKLQRLNHYRNHRGFALVFVLIFGAIGVALVGGLLLRASTNGALINRSNQYFNTLEAAEAATEKVVSEVITDFQTGGAAGVTSKTPAYRSRVPLANEHPRWGSFRFRDISDNDNATDVALVAPWAVASLVSQYRGLFGYAASFRVTSKAQLMDGPVDMGAAVQQEIQLATIPIFQFGIFYNLDLEICPGPNMNVSGRVHSNRNIYAQPQAQLVFQNDVTSAGAIFAGKHPDDPLNRTPGTITFNGAHDSGVSTLTLPIGTDNSPQAVRAIVEIPPGSEPPGSMLGQERLYNKADLIVLVYDNQVEVRGGVAMGNSPAVTWGAASTFISTNVTFYNKREGKTVRATQIDVAQFSTWNRGAGNPVTQSLGREVSSIFVADLRTQNGATQPGIRVVSGQTLPAAGLTIVTPDPLYVKGNYNVVSSALGTANTSQSKPAALIADSITVLSGNWSDANSSSSLSSRNASDVTVNAAFQAGIVQTGNGYYSGGVENFPRFLENWSGRTFTYNGSMVVMYSSEIATAPWKGTGSVYDVYNPPVRRWNFDLNFRDPAKLPPITPALRAVIRVGWRSVAAR